MAGEGTDGVVRSFPGGCTVRAGGRRDSSMWWRGHPHRGEGQPPIVPSNVQTSAAPRSTAGANLRLRRPDDFIERYLDDEAGHCRPPPTSTTFAVGGPPWPHPPAEVLDLLPPPDHEPAIHRLATSGNEAADTQPAGSPCVFGFGLVKNGLEVAVTWM